MQTTEPQCNGWENYCPQGHTRKLNRKVSFVRLEGWAVRGLGVEGWNNDVIGFLSATEERS